jgi:hypothetical protein
MGGEIYPEDLAYLINFQSFILWSIELFLNDKIKMFFMKEISKGLQECHGNVLEWRVLRTMNSGGINPQESDHRVEVAECPDCEASYQRRDKGKVMYVKRKGEDNYSCGTCRGDIINAKVNHPVFYSYIDSNPDEPPVPDTYVSESVPYCQNCEPRPVYNGRLVIRERTGDVL